MYFTIVYPVNDPRFLPQISMCLTIMCPVNDTHRVRAQRLNLHELYPPGPGGSVKYYSTTPYTVHNHIICDIFQASEKEWARAIAYITNQHMHPIQSFVLEA